MGKVLVYEMDERVRCGVCNEDMWWAGKGSKRARTCGCTPQPVRKITRRSASAKGKRGEREIEIMMRASGFDAQRTAGSGSTGSRNGERLFDTDIVARLGPLKKKIESKRLAKVPGLISMLEMLSGSDMLRVKQDRGLTGYWFMSDKHFQELASLAAEALRR